MIKKITLTLILFFLLISCGKKGDPEYKETQNIRSLKKKFYLKIN